MQIQGRWQGRFGQVFSDLCARPTTFASLHLRVFAFFSSNSLTRGLPPHPPRPLLPQPKPWGRGGAKRLGLATVLWLIVHRVSGCLVLARRAAHGLPVCVSHRTWETTPAPPKPGGRHMGDLVILEAELVFAKHYRYLTAND